MSIARPAAGHSTGLSPRLSRRAVLGICVAAPILPVAGCGASDPGYYTLTQWPGTAMQGGPLIVEVRSPSVAPYLDRDFIVRNDNGNRLKLDDQAAWASALPGMIGRTLALDLAQRLPGSTVIAQGGGISTAPLALVELDVSRFLADPSGQAEILATLSVHRPGGGAFTSKILHLAQTPDGAGIAALVATLSQLLGKVADEAADQLRALPPQVGPAALD